MSKTLTYFDVNGVAEPIRYILMYTNQEFKDVRIPNQPWPVKEIKDSLPFGQMPVLELDGGRVLHQSIAIARYVATNTELMPSDPWEQAILDAAVLTIYDFNVSVTELVHSETPEEKAACKKKIYDEYLDFYFSRFEKQLKERNGYFIGKLSWADFVLVGIIEFANLFLGDEIQKNYPNISALVKKIQEVPKIKEYTKNRKPYDDFI